MSLAIALPMFLFSFVASITPGPVNLVCLNSGTRYPLRFGLWFVTGATVGFIALFVSVGLGLFAITARIPGFDTLLTAGGVLFLLYLSSRLWLDDGRASDDADSRRTNAQRIPGFFTGAFMQWVNPKAWLASAAGIGAYTAGGAPAHLALFTAIYLPVCWLCLATWVLAGRFLRRFIREPVILQRINRGLAVLLGASCLLLLL